MANIYSLRHVDFSCVQITGENYLELLQFSVFSSGFYYDGIKYSVGCLVDMLNARNEIFVVSSWLVKCTFFGYIVIVSDSEFVKLYAPKQTIVSTFN